MQITIQCTNSVDAEYQDYELHIKPAKNAFPVPIPILDVILGYALNHFSYFLHTTG